MESHRISRRAFLANNAAAWGLSRGLKGRANENPPVTLEKWSNWSGSVECTPQILAAPETEDQVVQLVVQARRNRQSVRVAASGHSFVPICASQEALLSLDGLKGVVATDPQTQTATVLAGTKIYEMGEPLFRAGLAMENMGDIDRQGIAGAVSTGTHGTGKGIGSLSTQVVGLKLVTADGESLVCSAESEGEIFKAAQVSLGALGIITQINLRCLPAYRLHERKWQVPFEQCVADLDRLIADNRHFEFFWFSQTDVCWMKTLNPTEAAPSDLPDRDGERIGHSHRIFPSVRNNRFNEIEFAVPAVNGLDCLKEIRELMRHRHKEIRWPLEYRTVAADDIFISPASGRETVTISAHQGSTLPHEKFFADVEAIFRNHRGRPHWGKMHTHTAKELSQLYPKWNEFQVIRRQLDPNGRFLNDFLRRTLV